jgi:hypothetical protein
MKRLSVIIATVLFFSGVANVVAVPSGDDTEEASHGVSIEIPTVALVDVEGPDGNEAGTINLSPDVSNLEAGAAVDFSSATNSDLWLNYTSIIGKGNNGRGNGRGNAKLRKITAELDSNMPEGLELILNVAGISSGNGKTGNAVSGDIKLEKNAKKVVTNIGSCYTENGTGKGHRLTYSLNVKENKFDKLVAETFTVQVTYTITDK